ncbi:MAG TPA: hypothetical protein VGF18_09490 [Candidatus Tumulicola sp.]|jgi:hypothetical protein
MLALGATLAALLSLLVSVAPALPASFAPPKGWTAKPVPSGSPVDYLWVSPHFGANGNGENLTVTSHALVAGGTLASEVHSAIADMSQDRKIVNSHSEPTCNGTQPGWSFEGRITLPDGKTIAQIYHMAIYEKRIYMFVFTHALNDPIDPSIGRSIQTICPSAKA